MKIGLKPQPARNVVAVRGHTGDARFSEPPHGVHKVVLDLPITAARCVEFADEFEALLRKYGVEVWPREFP